MRNDHPKISFMCPSYNHGKYVAAFIRSVLAQTVPDWELIIVDDRSRDDNVAQIRQYQDPRIKLIVHKRNAGINETLNDAFKAASAPILSFIASDDELLPSYAETVLSAFSVHTDVGVVYTPLWRMDDNGCEVSGVSKRLIEIPPEDYFRAFFLMDNFIQSPGMAFKREFAEHIFPLSPGLFQYQDASLHMALARYTKAHHLDSPVVRYRFSSTSASSPGKEQVTQRYGETALYMEYAINLIGGDVELLKEKFKGDPVLTCGDILPEHIPFWMARIALTSKLPERRLWGLQKIVSCLAHEGFVAQLYDTMKFEYCDIVAMLRSCEPVMFTCGYDAPVKKTIFPGITKTKRKDSRELNVFGIKIRYKKRK